MPVTRYTRVAISLHWLIALLITINVAIALLHEVLLPETMHRAAIDTHKSIGITVLGLVILRLLWRFRHRPPALPDHHKAWEKFTAHGVHWLLYAVMIGLPITGWIMDSAWKDAATHPMQLFGLFEWPRIAYVLALDPATKLAVHDGFGKVHENLALVLYVLFFAHVAGALKHQFIDKDHELDRMGVGRSS